MRLKMFISFFILVIFLTTSYSVIGIEPIRNNECSLISPKSAAALFAGGDGSKNNPFQISNVTELQNMSANLSAHYVLINDINATNTSTWNSGLGFSPIGNDTGSTTPTSFEGELFNGSFDGKEYTIDGLYINRPDEQIIGLFGYVNTSAVIENVKLTDFYMKGYRRIGGLVGFNTGTVSNCSVEGFSWAKNNMVGGLIGLNNGPVTNCSADAKVKGDAAGGLLGGNTGTIKDCSTTGDTMSGYDNQGGIAGISWSAGKVINCTANVKVYGSGMVKGGLIGSNVGLVENCTAYGTTSSNSYSGGLIGTNQGNVFNCTAFGSAASIPNGILSGGLIARNYPGAIVSNCTAYGNATGKQKVGGLIGENVEGIVVNCSAFGRGKATQYDAGGLIGWNNGTVTYCRAFGEANNSLDIAGGLIGTNTDSGGVVTKCYSTGYVTGDDDVGGLIGNLSNGAMVQDCYSTSLTNGDNKVGGLIGSIHSSEVKNCYSAGQVIGTTYVGGMVGLNYSSYTNFSYWDNQTSGQLASAGGMPNYTADMMKQATFSSVGWNFTDIWGIVEDYTYPFLQKWHNPPKILTSNIEFAYEDALYFVDYDAFVSDYPSINYGTWSIATTAGSWLNFNANNGILSGTPQNDDVGTYWVEITITDLIGNSDSTNFFLEVFNTNDPPAINMTGVAESATEDELFSTIITADDPDPTPNVFNWTMVTNANWLNIDNSTGAISGTPTNDNAEKDYWVNVTCNDTNGGFDSENFTISVANINDQPEITTTGLANATEDEAFYIMLSAVDIDPTNDILTWNMSTDANWLGLNSSTGNLSGTPANDDVGTYWLNVTVSDGIIYSPWINLTLNVTNVNDDPKITTDDNKTVKEGELYSVDYEAIDIDPTGDTFTWSLNTNATWLSINEFTGVINGTPNAANVGSYWVNVTVSDSKGGSSSHNFTLTVISSGPEPEPPIPNKKPVITTIDVLLAESGVEYNVEYKATDDRTPVLNLSWSMSTNASWLLFNETTGILSGTPDENDVGSYWVNVTVRDDEDGIAFTNFTITVKPKIIIENKKPTLANGAMTPSSGNTTTKFTFSVSYTDFDNDSGDVWIWIDEDKYKMTADPNDTDATDGIEFTYKTKLGIGNHTYYFTAFDGIDEAITVDNTPITAAGSTSIPEIKEPEDGIKPEKEEKKEKEADYMPMIIAIIIIIIVILILLTLLLKKRKGVEPDEEFEEEFEEDKPLMGETVEVEEETLVE